MLQAYIEDNRLSEMPKLKIQILFNTNTTFDVHTRENVNS